MTGYTEQQTVNKILEILVAGGISPSTILAGEKTVTVAGVAEPLAVSTTAKYVTIVAKTTNTGIIKVGNATSQKVQLEATESILLVADNLNKIYIDATVNGEGVDYIGGA